jgi:hypothetical protein
VRHLILRHFEPCRDDQSAFTFLKLWDGFDLTNLDEAAAALDFDREWSEFIDRKEFFIRL